MKIALTIDAENVSFNDGNVGIETARVLREIADTIQDWEGLEGRFNVSLRNECGLKSGQLTVTH